ncbi:MAG: DUF4271 domain-containing protein [Bacteroides sp.]|nr:DUF4271 domain-containing protein [Bacteroides sp.]
MKIWALIQGVPIPYSIKTDDGITIILLVCFVCCAYIFGQSKRFLLYQGRNFILHKERSNLFVTSTSAEMHYLLFLLLQLCLLSSIYWMNYFEKACPTFFHEISSYLLLGTYTLLSIGYLLFKWILYSLIGWIFYGKGNKTLWLDSYSTLLYYLSLALFFPILLLVYFDLSFTFIVIIGLFFLIITKILIFYKWLKLFFNKKDGVLTLILYFCALEIVPCFIYYRVLILINDVLLIKF